MTNTETWLAAIATVSVLATYELFLVIAQARHPRRLARSAHAELRAEWFSAVSAQTGSEILAVQTLRNSLMSATMTASAAALGLMGTVTLTAPSLHTGLADTSSGVHAVTPQLALELVLLTLLFASLISSAMAVRYYNHAGFISGMPVGSEVRQRWSSAGSAYVRRAGLLYSWGLRHLVMVAPVLAFILHPAAGPIAAMAVVAAVFAFDRVDLQ